jgi:hypothetical protein
MAGSAQDVYVDNVVIVLDGSGSMNDKMRGATASKMAVAKSALKEVLGTIPQTTRVGLLVFSHPRSGWAYPLGPRDDAKLFAAIEAVEAGGGTPLGEYMKIGADTLLSARGSQYGYGSYRLLVVTDGEANDAPLMEAYTPDIVARGIVTDVIGLDMPSAHTLATKVHSYRRADDPKALRAAIQEVFAEVGRATDDGSAGNAFEELDGLPSDLAMAMISALASSGNHPIGAKPDGTVEEVPQAKSGGGRPRGRGPRGWVMPFGIAVIIIFSIMKSRRRR